METTQMKLAGAAAAAALATATLNADPETIHIWNEGEGGQKAQIVTLTWHVAEKPNGVTILICPGGGYGGLCSSYEGHDIARWLNGFGISGAVLEYRCAPNRHPLPLNDAKRAMRIVRRDAPARGLDPQRIGVIGFSAGGHLACTLATHFDPGDQSAPVDSIERISCRPDFQILVYPVVSMCEAITHGGSRDNLLGPDQTDELRKFLSNERMVTIDTPPAFVAHSRKDQMVPVENSRLYVAALEKAGVPVTYHELADGAHGLGCGNGPYWIEWQSECEKWLKANRLANE